MEPFAKERKEFQVTDKEVVTEKAALMVEEISTFEEKQCIVQG